MKSLRKLMVAGGLAALSAACTPSGGADVAARLDPTGLSSSALDAAHAMQPDSDDENERHRFDLAMIAPRLDAVAGGDLSRPNMTSAMDNQMSRITAMQTLNLAASVANAGIGAAMSGGASLAAAAPSLAMKAAGTAYTAAQMSAASSQMRNTMAQAEAERAASRVVPDVDRPAEAQAILSVIDGAGRSATWRNSASGGSGKVTIKNLSNPGLPGDLRCRIVAQEWRGSGEARKGNMMACARHGVWYDLS